MKKSIIPILILFSIILTTNILAATNISISYGWNGTDYIPFRLTPTGKLMTDINKVNLTAGALVVNNGDVNFTSNNILGFYYQNSTRRVGIGTSSPTHTLNVLGTLKITQNATFDQDVIITGTLYGGSPLKIAGGINLIDGNITTADGSVILASDGTGNLTVANDLIVIGNSYLKDFIFTANASFPDSILVNYLYPKSGSGITIRGDATFDNLLDYHNLTGIPTCGAGTLLKFDGTDLSCAGAYATSTQLNNSYGRLDSENTFAENLTISKDLIVSGNSYLKDFIFTANASFPDSISVSNIIQGPSNFIVNAAGRVGIGTSSPTHKLNVLGSGNFTGTVFAANFSGTSPIIFVDSSGNEIFKIYENSNITTIGTINAANFTGDGSLLTGISSGAAISPVAT